MAASTLKLLLILSPLVVLLILGLLLAPFVSLYLQALLCNCHIPFLLLIAMRVRHSDVRTIVLNRIRSQKAGLDIPLHALEVHALAGGRLSDTVSAMIGARAAGQSLTWEAACTQDLAEQHASRWSQRSAT